ncbi:serine hydrolase domain-containing protein [Streptomyces coffeae]|uniref:Beta-lactamase family protein n=1 Tax=Streptomyces coffeae TaxID=621382 RepID=A0ABS1NQB8_9ACTN|nr:serine hydrolase domain-containing protein [Streptomyces coffeae]MBL1101936.1 beta-lactamase family protein [Streptomyces coffeae]
MTVTTELELSAVRRLFDAEIDRGIETGVQLSVSCRGQVVDLAVGDNGAGHPMTSDTFVPWTCSSKPVGALAFGRAWESGAVDPDTPVCKVLPEFTGGGKERVKVRDLLTHTVGMPDPVLAVNTGDTDLSAFTWSDIEALIWAVICDAGTGPLPGAAMVYNPVTTWFVLDRLLTTLNGGRSGDSYRDLFDHLGLTATLGLDPGVPADRQVTVTASADQEAGLAYMRLASALPLPGVGVWGAVRDLRVVGEVLLAKGVHQGVPLVGPATVEALTSTHWPGSPDRSICDTDFPYGLGVMTLPAIFGRRTSARTFGHAGGNTSTLLVDPLFDLVVAVYWNGRLDDVRTFARRYALVRALYDDLGLPRLPGAARPVAPAGTE